MTIVFFVSSHGFGHASREIEVINAITRLRPAARLVVRSNVPRWFFEQSVSNKVELQACEVDTGVAQIDSLRMDETETARNASAFYADFHERVAMEAAVLRELDADVVVADVPPLGVAAAHLAGIRSVVLANFTWDWIYAAFPNFERLAPGVVETARHAYSHATCALRLPLHGGFEPMAPVTRDIPLVARRSRLGRSTVRGLLGLPQASTVVLASFGRYGLELPYDTIARENAFTLIVTDRENRGPRRSNLAAGPLVSLSHDALLAGGLHYEDLVAAADVVVSKPGYGIVSECAANDTALLYTSRDGFVEHDVMVREMPRMLRCRLIMPDDLMTGRWSADLGALLDEPGPPMPPVCNGAEVAADEILAAAAGAGADHPV